MVLSLRRFTLYCLIQQVDKGVWLIDPPSGRDQHIIRDGDIGGRYNCNTSTCDSNPRTKHTVIPPIL
ncbi:Uncharacterized protein APZ42_013050 [Daphnia magna]|uniref:Uncharacterized protein n=1 Tax=Daphnia magna TaxID=35525 RepID=A0A162R869_9CRUS|nr:Uncharacterized protein APZ42_013050 [Daphnia magna]